MPKHFKPGVSANPGGRKKGHYNLDRMAVMEACARNACNPFDILCELAMTSKNPKIKYYAASDLASYLAPKLKSIELKNDSQAPVVFNLQVGTHLKIENTE